MAGTSPAMTTPTPRPGPLQRLQILDQIVALGVVLEDAADNTWAFRLAVLALEGMAQHAVALDRLAVRSRRRELRLTRLALFVCADRETDGLGIIVAAAHAEFLRSLARRLQQPIQRGHRTVVQVRRRGPDAVQRPRAIARIGRGIEAVLAREIPDFRPLGLRDLLVVHPFAGDEVDHRHEA